MHRQFHRLMQFSIACFLLYAATLFAADDVHKHSSLSSIINESEFRNHVSYLASDELEGRGTGQEGIEKAAEFISTQFRKWGVQPGGEDETYYQNFTLKIKNKVGPQTRLSIGLDGRPTRRPASLNSEYQPL